MDKIKVFVIGSCTAEDILEVNPSDKDLHFIVDRFVGSISRSMYKPGKMAERLQEDTDFDIYFKSLPFKLQRTVSRQVNLITKQKNALSLLENVSSDSVVIVDVGYELSAFYSHNYELFDIFHSYEYIERHLPLWLTTLIDKHKYFFDSGIKEYAIQTWKNYKKFFTVIEQKKCSCIIMSRTLVKHVYDETSNQVIPAIPLFNRSFQKIFKHNKSSNQYDIFNYNNELIDSVYRILMDIADNRYPVFQIPIDKMYCDLHHPFGYHPTHYHPTCRQMLYEPLKKLIIETHLENEKRLNNFELAKPLPFII